MTHVRPPVTPEPASSPDRKKGITMNNTPQPIIEVRHLRREYPVEDDPVVALDDVSLDIARGEICCIFGPSGSGKSTLLNQLAGLEPATSGAVRIDGTIINLLDQTQLTDFRRRHMGFIFQSYNLLPHLSLLENTALPLLFEGISRNTREAKAAALLKAVGLEDRMRHKPGQMSGGQQQRAGIARAFITDPEIIFADEPTGNLDSKSSRAVMEMMHRFSRQSGKTIVIVSHDPDAAAWADHIITLKDGSIVEETWNQHTEHKSD